MVIENQGPIVPSRRGLVVGNYCHDVLIRDDVVIGESLGGASSFISAVLDGLSITADYVSKVGPDFTYKVNHAPIVSPSSVTTVFHAHFSSETSRMDRQDRILKRVAGCDPISPSDIPESKFCFGMAVGVAGEITPKALEKMLDNCEIVLVDIQSLIREFDPADGTVNLIQLKDSGFFHLLPRIGFLKASTEEAPFMNVEEVREWCCVVVTKGEGGCTVYWKDGELQIAPFPTVQLDPTGAGDSFLGGLVAGLVQGLPVPDAALLGNFFGSLTVNQIGLPTFDSRLLQRVRDEVQRRKIHCAGCHEKQDGENKFMKPLGHEQFLASLSAARLPPKCPIQAVDQDIQHQYTDQQKILVSSFYEEPIKSVESKP